MKHVSAMPRFCTGMILVLLVLGHGKADAVEPASSQAAEDWTQFRGPTGQGIATARNLPETWSETENVAWKTPLPGLGWSSPVIQDSKIWLTAALDEGRSLHLLCVDQATGKILRDVEVIGNNTPGTLHSSNTNASPTAIVREHRVFVHFGAYGTACLTTDGEIVWKTVLPHGMYYGPSSTPVLFEELLIVPCQGTDVQYTVGLDAKTGEIRWKQPLQGRNSESTPLIIETDEGPQLICNFADRVMAYDPRTGNELWSVTQGNNYAQVPRPVFGHGLIFICGGFFEPWLQAVRPGGKGDLSATNVAWSHRESIPQNPSPLLAGDELYLFSDKGIGTCLDAKTGTLHWRERLGAGGYSSPLSADGKIYFCNADGQTVVIRAGKEFAKLATNQLEGRIESSLAAVASAIYLRTDAALYRIERK